MLWEKVVAAGWVICPVPQGDPGHGEAPSPVAHVERQPRRPFENSVSDPSEGFMGSGRSSTALGVGDSLRYLESLEGIYPLGQPCVLWFKPTWGTWLQRLPLSRRRHSPGMRGMRCPLTMGKGNIHFTRKWMLGHHLVPVGSCLLKCWVQAWQQKWPWTKAELLLMSFRNYHLWCLAKLDTL